MPLRLVMRSGLATAMTLTFLFMGTFMALPYFTTELFQRVYRFSPLVTGFAFLVPCAATRWPERETVTDWSQGVPLAKLQALVNYWRSGYDLNRIEKRLNSFPQFRTRIDGLGVHFLHVRSKHENALPILLTHGWSGSVVEFLKVIGPLTDPTAHGGKAEDAFHVVVPSLPGFGFSDKLIDKGWNLVRIAQAWVTLMHRLGYSKWVAQGGDWGAGVTTVLGHMRPAGLAGIHLNWPFVFPEKIPTEELSTDEQRTVAAAGSAVAKLAMTLALRKGLSVVGVVRTHASAVSLRSSFPDAAIVTTEDHDWRDRVRSAAAGKPVRAVLDPVGGVLASDLIALLADGGSFIGYGDLSGQPISIPPLSFPARGLTMKGVSVGRWAGLPEAVRTADIRTAIEWARTTPDLFPVAAEYDLTQITDAVVHAEQPARTGIVLLTSIQSNQRTERL